MGSHSALFVRANRRRSVIERTLQAAGVTWDSAGDGWLRVDDTQCPAIDGDLPARLSADAGTIVVHFLIHTVTDLITITAFRLGRAVRRLSYAADGGWYEDVGRRLSFEDREALGAWSMRRPLASPDGYEILDAFLGRPGHGPRPEPPAPEVATWVMDELRAESQRQDRTMSWLMHQAWRIDRASIAALPEQTALEAAQGPQSSLELVLPADVMVELQAQCARLNCSLGQILTRVWQDSSRYVKTFPGVDDPL